MYKSDYQKPEVDPGEEETPYGIWHKDSNVYTDAQFAVDAAVAADYVAAADVAAAVIAFVIPD